MPSVVLFAQLLSATAFIHVISKFGIVDADPIVWEKARSFAMVAIAFLAALYTNVKSLQYANIETFIVFRASTPILISVLDFFFLGRELPNFR